ncbi:MAG: DUF1573 domain-containing protein [Bacteroidaceae bacterium]|nr:DUF1573 domain-containing protein [Bacteroidaceae bacterium]
MRFYAKYAAALICMTIPCFMTVSAQDSKDTDNNDYPEMTFVEKTHNFGIFDVEHGDKECWFVFKNTGKKDLIILSAQASCGCTEPIFPKTPIPPGASDSIKVTYKGSTRRPGVFKKTISLKTNCKIDSDYIYIMGEMVDKLVEDRLEK